MPATNSTPNYELPVYLPNDHFSVLGDLNSAMQTIDGELAAAATSVSAAAANASAALTSAQKAQADAESANASATAASISAREAVTNVTGLATRVEAAENSAASAVSTATSASSTATTAAGSASQASTAAQAAQTAAESAAATALAVGATADTALNKANQALGNVQHLQYAGRSQDIDVPINGKPSIGTINATGLVPGTTHLIVGMVTLQINSGTSGDKNVVIKINNSPVRTFYYNGDDYKATIPIIWPINIDSSTADVNLSIDSSASAVFKVLAQGTWFSII